MDAQRRKHGLNLLAELERTARADGIAMLQCWCRQSLDANEFWKAAGFVKVALRDVGAKRQSPCILWRRPLLILPTSTIVELPTNTRNQAGRGETVARFNWARLPMLQPFSPAEVISQVKRIGMLAS